jgi:ribonuclease R
MKRSSAHIGEGRVAMEAEREAIKACKLEFMRNRIGEEFEAIVSGVVKYGIFVELVDYLVEGLIRISEIGDDYYVFDEKQYSFIGERSGRRIRLGDDINVQLVRVDAIKREIDFVLAEKEQEKKNDGRPRTGKRRR